MNFKSVIIIVFVLSFILFDHALHAEQPLEDLALTSAQRWLSLVDEGKYSESWDEASQYFKTAIPEKQWLNSLEAFRKPLMENMSSLDMKRLLKIKNLLSKLLPQCWIRMVSGGCQDTTSDSSNKFEPRERVIFFRIIIHHHLLISSFLITLSS
jgi:hypothetical protein